MYFSNFISQESQILLDTGDLIFTVVSADAQIEKGDYNGNFKVDMIDAVFIKNQLLAAQPAWYPNVAEVSGADNRCIDLLDLVCVKKLLFDMF